MAIARWDEVRTGLLGERMIRFLERYPKADEIYITSAMDGDHGEVSHHYGWWYKGSRTVAIDIGAGGFPAGSAKMRDIARWLYDNFADYTVELIHTTPFQDDNGFYVKNQKRYPGGAVYGEATKSEHRNHVHWGTSAALMTAMEQGAGPSPLQRLAIPCTKPVWGWDASDYDWSDNRGPMDLVAAQRDGISFFIHKTTEGGDWQAVNFQTALERARAAGIPVLGAYHFLWPGNIEGQVDFWLDYVERRTPWWKDVPWIWQIDAEGSKDTPPPSADEVARAVAAVRDRLARRGNFGYVIAYAPFSKYGNGLPPGFDIWNANYNGSGDPRPFRQQYEGVTDTAPGWNVMSGRKPRILQFTEDGHVGLQSRCDVNKFDGTLHDLIRLCGRDPELIGVPPLREMVRERIAFPIDRILVPGRRSLDTTTTEGIDMSLDASEQGELLQLLRDLGPLTQRLEELLARSSEDGGGGIGTRSLDGGQPAPSAGPGRSDYWNLGHFGEFGITRSLDQPQWIDPQTIHNQRGRYVTGRRTPLPTARDLPRTRGIDVGPGALRAFEPIDPGRPVDHAMKIGDVTGPGLTDRFGMAATDLGVLTQTPSGRILAVFGDTFRDPWVPSDDWRATVGLISDTKNLDGGIVWTEAAGPNPNNARQLWDYPHIPTPIPGEFSTVLPSDVMTIGNTIYLHTSAHFPFGYVGFTEIWKSVDDGRTWQRHGPRWEDPFLHGGLAQLWTWDRGDDGFVYIMSTGFRRERDQPIILRRVPADRIDDPGAYQGWGWGPDEFGQFGWAWGHEPTPVLDGGYGELCLRRIDGQWVLVAFNARDYRLDVKVFPDFENSDLNTWPTTSPIVGGDWGQERGDSVAQLYGPSIIPGSRPGSGFHIFLSQWRNPGSWPYHVMQFKIPMPGAGGPRDLEPTGGTAPRKAPTKTAPRKTPLVKKVPAKKVPAKKEPAKKAPVRKAPAERSPRRATGDS
ncbi:DUF4185 domain-containing protein [Candidatus Mycolicibacterium alkanivorans]|uniref:DUF4185 domain-containing protein n=1 Tax=Candidatus Mycolicibacterium alkanivorans TaxID=2954114 RepID=A0ABS9YSQ1_9MYCO|nr:DUF4185 domain-containing protein [Candidatus Mycolicibacterium alkanivorans]MCI4674168.1 DUF4185 domain-containing protein [Candidatus Mycolicibacterium alkanivorans]